MWGRASRMLLAVAALHSQILSVLGSGPLSGHRRAGTARNRHHVCVFYLIVSILQAINWLKMDFPDMWCVKQPVLNISCC